MQDKNKIEFGTFSRYFHRSNPLCMSEKNPFDDYRDVTDLVAHYEETERNNAQLFLDEASFEQLIDYYELKKKSEKASKIVSIAIEQYPYSSYFLVKKAQFFFDVKQFDQALEVLEKAEVFDPKDMQIHLLRADIYVWMEDFKRAVATVEYAMTIGEKDDMPDLYLELADVYEEWEKYEQVFDCLKKTLEFDPNSEEALNRMWFCVEFIEKYQESVDFHKMLIDREPYNHRAWFNLGHAYSGLGDYENAVDAFDFVLAINEKSEYAYKDCGDVLFRMENYRKAIEYYKSSFEVARPTKEILYNIGECYECLEEYAMARNYYRKAVNMDPNFHPAFFRIGLCYHAEQKWSNALTSLERACKLKDDDPDYIEVLADSYYELGNLDSAIESFAKAIDIRPESREAWLALARTLLEAGMHRDSFTVLDDACEQFDDPADIFYVKSAYYFLIGNKKESLLNFEKALLLDYKMHPIVFEIAPNMEKELAVQQVVNQYRV